MLSVYNTGCRKKIVTSFSQSTRLVTVRQESATVNAESLIVPTLKTTHSMKHGALSSSSVLANSSALDAMDLVGQSVGGIPGSEHTLMCNMHCLPAALA